VIGSEWLDAQRPDVTRSDVTRIAVVRPRHRVTVIGTVRSTAAETIGTSPAFRSVIADGSGEVALLFLGQQQVAGLTPGRRCTAEGMATVYRGHLVIWNPRYALEPAEPPCDEAADGSAGGQPESGRVVVIYDDPGLGRVIEVNLATRGYQVAVAGTATAADCPELRAADLVIVDIGVDEGSCLKTVGTVRGLTAAPIVAISALNDEAVRRAVLAAGADDFVVKPFPIGVLLARAGERLAAGREALTVPDHAG
jgi:CheY-like chemotaxis protein